MTHISIEFSHRSRSSCYDHLQSLWKVRVGLNQDYNRLKATLKKKGGVCLADLEFKILVNM